MTARIVLPDQKSVFEFTVIGELNDEAVDFLIEYLKLIKCHKVMYRRVEP